MLLMPLPLDFISRLTVFGKPLTCTLAVEAPLDALERLIAWSEGLGCRDPGGVALGLASGFAVAGPDENSSGKSLVRILSETADVELGKGEGEPCVASNECEIMGVGACELVGECCVISDDVSREDSVELPQGAVSNVP